MVVTLRSLQIGLIAFVQATEDFISQFTAIRGELELALDCGAWNLPQVGTLADDSTESGGQMLASRELGHLWSTNP